MMLRDPRKNLSCGGEVAVIRGVGVVAEVAIQLLAIGQVLVVAELHVFAPILPCIFCFAEGLHWRC